MGGVVVLEIDHATTYEFDLWKFLLFEIVNSCKETVVLIYGEKAPFGTVDGAAYLKNIDIGGELCKNHLHLSL